MESLSLNLKKLFGYARGYLLKTKITTLGPIKSYGRTIIRNRRGKVIIGKRSLLWPKVVFDFTSAPPAQFPSSKSASIPCSLTAPRSTAVIA